MTATGCVFFIFVATTTSTWNEMSAPPVIWSKSLRGVLEKHINAVRSDSKMPPLSSTSMTSGHSSRAAIDVCFEALRKKDRLASSVTRGITEQSVEFVVDLFEQCCSQSLLTPAERECVTAATKLRPGKGTSAPASKKRRVDYSGSIFGRLVYSEVLPAEYFLRFLFALPRLLENYQMQTIGSPVVMLEQLWTRVQTMATTLEKFSFYPVSQYAPML